MLGDEWMKSTLPANYRLAWHYAIKLEPLYIDNDSLMSENSARPKWHTQNKLCDKATSLQRLQ